MAGKPKPAETRRKIWNKTKDKLAQTVADFPCQGTDGFRHHFIRDVVIAYFGAHECKAFLNAIFPKAGPKQLYYRQCGGFCNNVDGLCRYAE